MKKQVEFLPRPGRIHYKACFLRYLRQTFTNPWTAVPLFLEAPFMLLIVFFVYEDGTYLEPWKHHTSACATGFLLALASGLMALLGSYREICKEREILTREVFGGLNLISYLGAKISVLTITGFVQTLILMLGSLIFIDYNFESAFADGLLVFIALFLTNCSMAAIGLLVSALLKKSESAILPVLVIIVMQVVFSGSVIEFDAPINYFTFITPVMYGTSVVGAAARVNSVVEIRDIFDYNIWASLAILLLFCVVCYVLTAVKLKYDYRTKD